MAYGPGSPSTAHMSVERMQVVVLHSTQCSMASIPAVAGQYILLSADTDLRREVPVWQTAAGGWLR